METDFCRTGLTDVHLYCRSEGNSEMTYQLPKDRPVVRKQVKAPQPEDKTEQSSIVGVSRKRTASTADLDIPETKKPKVDAAGTILLDDDDDDDLEIL
jgi:hypothetical protein